MASVLITHFLIIFLYILSGLTIALAFYAIKIFELTLSLDGISIRDNEN